MRCDHEYFADGENFHNLRSKVHRSGRLIGGVAHRRSSQFVMAPLRALFIRSGRRGLMCALIDQLRH